MPFAMLYFYSNGGKMNLGKLHVFFQAAFLLSLIALSSPAASAQDVHEVVRRMDELYRADSSYAEVDMEIVTPHWQRTLRMKIWTEGKRKTFIRILSPPKERGVTTLRIGSEMWNYLPRADKVIKIPPSMMMSSWMGSDFTNDDLVKEFTLLDDYTYEFVYPQDAKADLLYIALTPKEGVPVVWGKIVAAVQKENYLPLWDRYYDEKGNLMRIIEFKDVKRLGGRLIPAVMELLPQNKEGQKTVLRYLQAEFDTKLPEDTFSLRNLQSRK
jgi:outer membrane lipoprotein-sorting protein